MKIIYILSFLIFGVAFLFRTYESFSEFLVFRKLKKTGLKAKGKIKEFEKEVGDTSDTYHPIIQFFTYSSEEIIGKPFSGGYTESEYFYSPREVEIIYLESNPEIFIIKGQGFGYIAFFIFNVAIIGFLFL
ncbi:DUF3592 domain-containing protein [Emticicia fontis]